MSADGKRARLHLEQYVLWQLMSLKKKYSDLRAEALWAELQRRLSADSISVLESLATQAREMKQNDD